MADFGRKALESSLATCVENAGDPKVLEEQSFGIGLLAGVAFSFDCEGVVLFNIPLAKQNMHGCFHKHLYCITYITFYDGYCDKQDKVRCREKENITTIHNYKKHCFPADLSTCIQLGIVQWAGLEMVKLNELCSGVYSNQNHQANELRLH